MEGNSKYLDIGSLITVVHPVPIHHSQSAEERKKQ